MPSSRKETVSNSPICHTCSYRLSVRKSKKDFEIICVPKTFEDQGRRGVSKVMRNNLPTPRGCMYYDSDDGR